MIPVRAKGENAPALAPQMRITHMKKASIPISQATVMAIGANKATVPIFPVPVVDSPAEKTKNINGAVTTLLLTNLMMIWDNSSRVPFCLAIPNK